MTVEKGCFDVAEPVMLEETLLGHIRSLLVLDPGMGFCHNHQEQMEDLAKVPCRSHQAPRVAQGTVVGDIQRVLRVALGMDDDHSLALKDSFRSLQAQGRHTVLVALARDAVALALCSTPQPSCLHPHLQPLDLVVCLPYHSRPSLYLDPAHKLRLLALLWRIPLVGQILLCLYLEILVNSTSHWSTDFVTSEVLIGLFSYRLAALNRWRSMVVIGCHTHLWLHHVQRAHPGYFLVLLFLVDHIYSSRHQRNFPGYQAYLAMFCQMVF